MKHKFASQIVVLFTLLALTFSAVGVKPAQADGPFSHNEVVRQAYNLLDESELKALLRDYQGTVLAGSVFPDWAMVAAWDPNPNTANYYKMLSEWAHFPQFAGGYLHYIQSYYPKPYSPEAKQSIAFLLGILAHQVSDVQFHWEFMPHAYDLDPSVGTHLQIEWDIDAFTIYHCGFFGCGYKYNDVNWDSIYNAAAPVIAAYQEMHDAGIIGFTLANPGDLGLGWGEYLVWSKTQVTSEGASYWVNMALRPNGFREYWDYQPGGIADEAQHSADAWQAAWKVLNDSAYTGRYYVKPIPAGSDTANCDSWATACTLQRALYYAVPGTQIWVAQGTYKPTTGAERTATFQIGEGVEIYGGFEGVDAETQLTDRDLVNHVATLSGDLLGNDNTNIAFNEPTRADNSYHVVSGAVYGTSRLDGFVITGGNANGNSFDSTGGGNDSGGGMYNNNSRAPISNVTFINNSAKNRGGGLYNYFAYDKIIENVTFSNNSATNGGGMANAGASPSLINVTFSGNKASGSGGGMYNTTSLDATAGNNPPNTTYSNPTLTNVTISGNTATVSGGGIYNYGGSPTIRNTILWGNTAANGAQISNSSSTPTVSDSVIQNGYAGGTKIFTGNPKLGTLAANGGPTQTIAIQQGSSAINKGGPTYCTIGSDQRGVPYAGGFCDIGAYEYTGTVNIYYVKPGGTSIYCSSWSDACDLAQALSMAVSNPQLNEIWVAKGVYYPGSAGTRTATFQLTSGVGVYGGFPDTGTPTFADRDPDAHPTILSGDVNGDDNQSPIITNINTVTGNTNNAYHVVTGADNAVLDGFTITAGYADNGALDCTLNTNACGGGMLNVGTSPNISNVTFQGNLALMGGGGMMNFNNSATIANTTFVGNKTGNEGGGLLNYVFTGSVANSLFDSNQAVNGGAIHNKQSNATFTDVTVQSNTASSGGGVANYSSSTSPTSPKFINVTFKSNTATNADDTTYRIYGGGGMYNWTTNTILQNVTFFGNNASGASGGGLLNEWSSPTLTNVTFSGNTAFNKGGGIVNNNNSDPQISNTILWGNTAASGAQIHDNTGDSTPSVAYSVVQGGYGGTGNLSTDPLLGTLGNYGGLTQTIPIKVGSSAINKADASLCTIGSDQRGVGYVGVCDIGAYEYDYTGVYYVKPTASVNPTTADCQGWNTACTLQTALVSVSSGDEIWVMAGAYHSTETVSDRAATFQLVSGVNVYGGFAGTEATRDARDAAANLTVLSGDIDHNDSQTPIITDIQTVTGNINNSYHVVTGADNAVLDGFTITAGYAYGTSFPTDAGGGMLNNASSPTVTNVTFAGNAAPYGGGMYNNDSSPAVTNVTFSGNLAIYYGGGMTNGASNPTLTNVTFSGNQASASTSRGGGLYNDSSNPTLTNVTFSSNTSTQDGGGMLNYSGSNPTVTNVTFSDNSATFGGGMYNWSSNPTVTNVTFSDNSAATLGGGMYNYSSSPTLKNVLIANSTSGGDCVLNSSTINAASVNNLIESTGTSACDLPNGTNGNIIGSDPTLGTLGNYGGLTQTIPLLLGSSAINSGDDATCYPTDQRGVARPQGLHCDIGAYEYDYSGVYYVKPIAAGTEDCQSWANACELQTALVSVSSGDEIWVMAGTYKPTSDTDRTATFQLKDGLSVYGGFAGTETARAQRNPATNVTILSGDIDNDDSQTPIITDLTTVTGNTTNSYHVVTGATGATLDGFTITAGYANAADQPNNLGGGLYNNSVTNAAFVNLVIRGNYASGTGGGVDNHASTPTFMNVTILDNEVPATGYGGGGMFNWNSNSIVINATFSGNRSSDGGGMYNDWSAPQLTNVTFTNNAAAVTGGGIFNNNSSNATIANTILWGNTPTQIVDSASIPTVSYSVIQDGYASGTNIITTDPKLGTLGYYGGFTPVLPLLAGSSAIDTGNDSVCPATDQRGITRPQGTHCDIGAYEAYSTIVFKSAGVQDGWILESGEKTNKGGTLDAKSITLRLGDDAVKKQYLGILSFVTKGLPDDAVITKVTLKVRKQGVVGGGNPVTTFQGFMVDIKKGTFGTAALQIGDFQAPLGTVGKTYGPFKPALVGGWYSINLTAGRAYINKAIIASGLTQIRLRFKSDDNNNLVANYLSLFSGNGPLASQPQLIIEYYVP